MLALRDVPVLDEEVVDNAAVTMTVLPTITNLSFSFSLALSWNTAASSSFAGKTLFGSASRSILSPTQHKDGNADDGSVVICFEVSAFTGGKTLTQLDVDDDVLFHEPFDCITGCNDIVEG